MTAYYNEFDPYAAQWLRNLIAAGEIAPGIVDERSIEDVHPNDLRGFTQCHWFAGVGVWSYALRRAGWPDDRPVWTGSCPCQPFSSAGQGAGFADERHLWPAFFHLIGQRRPAVVFGEQVASKDVEPWIDLVQADVESLEYALGAIAFPSAGIGAPHLRDRLYWVADSAQRGRRKERAHTGGFAGGNRAQRHAAGSVHGSSSDRLANHNGSGRKPGGEGRAPLGYGPAAEPDSGAGRLADPHQRRWDKRATPSRPEARPGAEHASSGKSGQLGNAGNAGLAQRERFPGIPGRTGGNDAGQAAERAGIHVGGMADTKQHDCGPQAPAADHGQPQTHGPADRPSGRGVSPGELANADCGGMLAHTAAGPVNGFWATADWLFCRDERWRPVEPQSFPLVASPAGSVGRSGPDWRTPAGPEGFGHRVGRLRGYGNAINAAAAEAFIRCYLGT